MQQWRKSFEVKGMLTIEASIVVPIIFMVLVGMMYIAFYLHDMTVARSLLGSSKSKEELYRTLNEALLIGDVESVELEQKVNAVQKKVEIKFSILFFNIQKTETIAVDFVDKDFLDDIRKIKVFDNRE